MYEVGAVFVLDGCVKFCLYIELRPESENSTNEDILLDVCLQIVQVVEFRSMEFRYFVQREALARKRVILNLKNYNVSLSREGTSSLAVLHVKYQVDG